MKDKEVRKWQDDEALKRFRLISPLIDDDTDEGKKLALREEIAAKNGISKRTLYRYEAAYRADGFNGLRPQDREKHRVQGLPENWDEILGQAIQLKREVPKRSVRQIIKILETEGWAAPGVLKKSTLQRHLYDAGFGVKQMKKVSEGREKTSSRRFCRPHRMELVQGDIKYGPTIVTADGEKIKTYLSSLIDDHSRLILQAEFYDNQREEIVEDTFHKAILKYGIFDATYLDNGTQYRTDTLEKSLARLGIRVLHARVRAAESKGKIEKYHQVVDSFIEEIRVEKVHTLSELNYKWKVYLEQEYQKEAHAGIAEYYQSYGVDVPSCGITPEQEFNRDTRGLTFVDVHVVSEAFLHLETRQIDNAGCFTLNGIRYEASAALANVEAVIAFDPMNTESVEVRYRDMEPFPAHRLRIGAYADKKPAVSVAMTDELPETSRLLHALEKKYKEDHHETAYALSFEDYGKEGTDHV